MNELEDKNTKKKKKVTKLDNKLKRYKNAMQIIEYNQNELIKKDIIKSSLNVLETTQNDILDDIPTESLEDFLTEIIALHIPFKGPFVEEIISNAVVTPVIAISKYGLKSIDDILFYSETKMTKDDYIKKIEDIKNNSLKFSGNLIKNMNRPTDKNELIVELYKQCYKNYDSDEACKRITSDFGITRSDLDTIKSLVIYIAQNPESMNYEGDKMTSEHLKTLGILQ